MIFHISIPLHDLLQAPGQLCNLPLQIFNYNVLHISFTICNFLIRNLSTPTMTTSHESQWKLDPKKTLSYDTNWRSVDLKIDLDGIKKW
jgi:hypothetical protein